jgi:hypothetical protein
VRTEMVVTIMCELKTASSLIQIKSARPKIVQSSSIRGYVKKSFKCESKSLEGGIDERYC